MSDRPTAEIQNSITTDFTAETSRNKACRSFTYLIVDWQTI